MNFPGSILYIGFLVLGIGIGYSMRRECNHSGVLALEKDNVTCHTDLKHYKDDFYDIKQQLSDCTQNKDTFQEKHQVTDRELAKCEATTPLLLEGRNNNYHDEYKKCTEQLTECTKKSSGYFS